MRTSSLRLTSIAATLALMGQFAGAMTVPDSANAADMLADYGEPTEYTEVEFGTGWYLRGDIGGGISSVDVESSYYSEDVDYGDPITIGLGAGYTFAEGLRMEVALNIFENSEINASNLMGNFYADLGTYAGFRPYVGAGLGAAYVYWDDFSLNGQCNAGSVAECGVSGGEELTYAANAMLGVSYELSRGLNLDLGYRYTYFGEGGTTDTTDTFGNVEDLTVGNKSVHEMRLGLRYEIW
ncbi:MAG: outer membrane beta-barrel protein [Rhizobiaceae bacterium]